jgi:hypothetical protein
VAGRGGAFPSKERVSLSRSRSGCTNTTR